VAARVGYDPFFPYASVTILADVERVGDRLEGRIKLLDDKGVVRGARTLREPIDHCAELVSAMGLAISIALDTVAAPPSAEPPAESPIPANPPTTEPPEAARADRPPEAEAPPASAPAPALRPFVGIGVLGTTGSEPNATLGMSVFGGARWRWMSATLDARADLPGTTQGPNGGTVEAQLLVGSIVPCAHLSVFASCILVSAGILHASGANVSAPDSRDLFYLGLGARLGLEVPVGRSLVVPIFAEARAPLTRPTLHIADGEAWRAPALTAAAELGLKWHFP
jgi:hypothetical protein